MFGGMTQHTLRYTFAAAAVDKIYTAGIVETEGVFETKELAQLAADHFNDKQLDAARYVSLKQRYPGKVNFIIDPPTIETLED